MSLEEWVTGFTYALFSVLILIEVGTLIKLLREGEHKECIKIMVLYISCRNQFKLSQISHL